MEIISKNMIVTTIPSGGANVNLFFALFPRADKMLIGSIIASGFRDKKHSRNDAEDILRIAHLKIAYLGWAILIFTFLTAKKPRATGAHHRDINLGL